MEAGLPKIVLRDQNFVKNFKEDESGLATVYNYTLNYAMMFDTVEHLESERLSYLAQGIVHVYTIRREGFFLQIFQREYSEMQPDYIAFQLGHMVGGIAIAIKEEYFFCRKKSDKLNLCSGCQQNYYCDRNCQSMAFSAHKKFCKTIQKDRKDNKRLFVKRGKDMEMKGL
jgi:hypothetical protein